MTDYGLTLEQVREKAPSVFAEGAYENMSPKYRKISTAKVLENLMGEGFVPFSAREANTMTADRKPFVNHIVRLRHKQDIERPELVGDTVNEVLLWNSSDGSKPYSLLVGAFRTVCLNGMVVGDSTMLFNIRHKGDPEAIANAVVGIAYAARGLYSKVTELRERMVAMTMNDDLRVHLAERALEIKFGHRTPTLEPQQFLVTRRYGDETNTLWGTFNVIQENVIRGGLEPVLGRSSGKRSRVTRPITSIADDIRINAELWSAAEEILAVA